MKSTHRALSYLLSASPGLESPRRYTSGHVLKGLVEEERFTPNGQHLMHQYPGLHKNVKNVKKTMELYSGLYYEYFMGFYTS